MSKTGQHIISRLRWHTTFDDRDKSNELQSRLSVWSRLDMHREVNAIFDRFCPPDKVWIIPALELDLGEIDYSSLESGLTQKVKLQLIAKLQELLVRHQLNAGAEELNITDIRDTGIRFLRHFLVHGVKPWNDTDGHRNVNDILEEQWANGSDAVMDMLREIAGNSREVRRRMAWQVSEPNIIAIVKKMEPANCEVIVEFKNSMVAVQEKEPVVQTSVGEFKKNLWFWILNYLFTTHGSLFNKKEFLKSAVRQMAAHYNIQYEELLRLVMQIASKLNIVHGKQKEFLVVLNMIAQEVSPGISEDIPLFTETENKPRKLIREYFLQHTYRQSSTGKKELNDLVLSMAQKDAQWFRSFLMSVKYPGTAWTTIVNDLDDIALEAVFTVWNAGAKSLVQSIHFLSVRCKTSEIKIPRNIFWEAGAGFLAQHGNGTPQPRKVISWMIAQLEQHTHTPATVLLEKLIANETAAHIHSASQTSMLHQLQREYAEKILAAPLEEEQSRITVLLQQVSRQDSTGADRKKVEDRLEKFFHAHPAAAIKALFACPDKGIAKKVLSRIVTEQLARKFLPHLSKEKVTLLWQVHDTFAGSQQSITGHSTSLPASVLSIILIKGVQEILINPADPLPVFMEKLMERVYKNIPASAVTSFGAAISRVINGSGIVSYSIPVLVKEKLLHRYAYITPGMAAERILHIVQHTPYRQEEVSRLLILHYRNNTVTALRNTNNAAASSIIGYLLPGGVLFKQELIKDYTEVIATLYKTHIKTAIIRRLNEIFWKTIVQHGQHKGEVKLFAGLFYTAVVFNFPFVGRVAGNGQRIAGSGEGEGNRDQGPVISDWGLVIGEQPTANTKQATTNSEQAPANTEQAPANKEQASANKEQATSNQQPVTDTNPPSAIRHPLIPEQQLLILLEECLNKCTSSVVLNNITYKCSIIWNNIIRRAPSSVITLIKQYPLTPQRLNIIAEAGSFTNIIPWLIPELNNKAAMQASALQHLYEYAIALLPATSKEKLQQEYWNALWTLIDQNGLSAKTFEQLLDAAIHPLVLEQSKNILAVWTDWEQKQVWFLPGIRRSLQRTGKTHPGFTSAAIKIRPGIQLFRSGQIAWMKFLLRTVIDTKQVPLWFPHHEPGYTAADLLNDAFAHFPAACFRFCSTEQFTPVQMEWLTQNIDTNILITAVKQLDPERRRQLHGIQQCITVQGSKTWGGITSAQIQKIVSAKIFTAWITGNWRILSPNWFWQELAWALYTRYNVSEKRLFMDIERNASSLPEPFRKSFERLFLQYRKQKTPAAVSLPEPKKINNAMKQQQSWPAKEGIAVFNAGLVIINSYILLLFDRLGITSGNKFVSEKAQIEAVHLLQYIVTGHSHTEEHFLPLNKFLCGLDITHPVPDGIEIPESTRSMIEGLLKAVIGYWPAIGDTSADGFRGNWLVRKGVLGEAADKWELTVEKRAYDILLNRSPFSFSVVKLPWMERPLHVNWAF